MSNFLKEIQGFILWILRPPPPSSYPTRNFFLPEQAQRHGRHFCRVCKPKTFWIRKKNLGRINIKILMIIIIFCCRVRPILKKCESCSKGLKIWNIPNANKLDEVNLFCTAAERLNAWTVRNEDVTVFISLFIIPSSILKQGSTLLLFKFYNGSMKINLIYFSILFSFAVANIFQPIRFKMFVFLTWHNTARLLVFSFNHLTFSAPFLSSVPFN